MKTETALWYFGLEIISDLETLVQSVILLNILYTLILWTISHMWKTEKTEILTQTGPS